jgi:hypothetical protein
LTFATLECRNWERVEGREVYNYIIELVCSDPPTTDWDFKNLGRRIYFYITLRVVEREMSGVEFFRVGLPWKKILDPCLNYVIILGFILTERRLDT